jgi:hypothetical protein
MLNHELGPFNVASLCGKERKRGNEKLETKKIPRKHQLTLTTSNNSPNKPLTSITTLIK